MNAITYDDVRFVKVENMWTVSFKRRRSGKLLNITVRADSLVKACLAAALTVAQRYPGKSYQEYGVSQATEMQEGRLSWGPGGLYLSWYRYGIEVEKAGLKYTTAQWHAMEAARGR